MPKQDIYLPDDIYFKAKQLENLSQICQRAVLEEFNLRKKTSQEWESLIISSKNQIEKLENDILFFKKKYEETKQEEDHKKLKEEELKQVEVQKVEKYKEKVKEKHAYLISYTFDLALEEAKKLALEWDGKMLKQFAEARGLNYNVKKYQEAYEKIRQIAN